MLLELRVENYAVIDNVAVEFAPGLNLLTGETGAGKSILIDALSLLLGDKASPEMIRHGAERAAISGVFEVNTTSAKAVAQILEANGLDEDDNQQLILRRDIASSGKSRVFVNNQPATVAVLKQLAVHVGSIHAQSQTVLAFDAAARLELLDAYAGNLADSTADAYTAVHELRGRIAELERDEQDRLRLLDLWSFQKKEIEGAKLEVGEDQKLETEKRVLANAEKLHGAANAAYEALYEGSVSVVSLLRSAERQVEEIARYDAKLEESIAALSSARANVEDVSATLRAYADGIDASPERLAEVEDRLALLDRLKRKYGAGVHAQTIDEVIQFGASVAEKLNQIENRDETLKELHKHLSVAATDYLKHARTLSKTRIEAAKKLEKIVEAEINDLAMKAKFKIDIAGSDNEANWTSSGFDTVIYVIATNAGEPLKPVEQIASGGELSRVMLALKASVETGKQATNGSNGTKRIDGKAQRTLVFDEIDSGIGGRAAEAVGRKLKALSRHNQVLCITHLPQIASFADQHYVIEKKETGGRTKTSVRSLSQKERTEEIARMLSGAKLTETSLKHAEQMLKANA